MIFEYLMIGAIYVTAFACFSSQRDEVWSDLRSSFPRYGLSLVLGLMFGMILFVIGWPIIALAQLVSAANKYRKRFWKG